ncbi:DHH family phosphoesterase [Candidatus Saccharibacteria bacterium]|nr:DHH family phosphoesterase [Candidatus Saccharibacteria bacterium]
MTVYDQAEAIAHTLQVAQRVVVLQADNPDGDSLGSSLALEQILSDLGKEPYLYCGVDMPTYLRYLDGWDRVHNELPKQFDASIIVDTSSLSLFENLERSGQRPWLASRSCIVIDHHAVESSIPFASIICNQPTAATGEVLYELSQQLDWPTNLQALKMLAISILSDSLGLVSEATTARTIRIIAEIVDKGVSLAELDSVRRDTMRKSPELVRYKGELLQRVEYFDNNRIAMITIPWAEIERYSHAYNPSMLVIDDMRLTEGTDVAIAFKTYRGGRVTAKIRTNFGKTIAGELAKHFNGGGHAYASGFKITDGRTIEQIKQECITMASQLLDRLEKGKTDETIQ